MAEHILTIRCGSDEIIGILHKPEQFSRDLGVLIIVGGPQYRVGSHRQFVLMARRFAAAGYPVLRFDYRGMGDSSGTARTFESVDDDVCAAIDAFLRESPALSGVVLFGLCDAASAALMYCGKDSRLKGLVLANPWVRTESGAAKTIVRHYYGQRLLQRSFWSKAFHGDFSVSVAARDFFATLNSSRGVNRRYKAGVSAHFLYRMREGMMNFSEPIALLLSGNDLTAREFDGYCSSSADWRRWVSSAQVTRFRLEDADHTFSSSAALEEASTMVINWLDKIGGAT